MKPIYHALVLNMHQPPGNLEWLLEHQEWEAKEILWAYDRMPRALWGEEDLARVHIAASGTLLTTLADPEFQRRVYGIARTGDILWHWQNEKIFRILGSGFYHPVLPLIPELDRPAHLEQWHAVAKHLFWREQFGGFWPPEMSFSMELIPLLKRFGYRYVLVDSHMVVAKSPMSWQELRYRPHYAEYNGERIIVVVRDRELSDAQESGMDAGWFEHECYERTKWCDFPPLITTCTDGDNGGWFRNTNDKGNFWHVFYKQLLDKRRQGHTDVTPTYIDDYLDEHGAHGEVIVRTGAWNTGEHSGIGFQQWTGSQQQRDSWARVRAVSADVHEAGRRARAQERYVPEIDEAFRQLMRAETSCNFFWGEAWVDRAHQGLSEAEFQIDRVRESLGMPPRGAQSAPTTDTKTLGQVATPEADQPKESQ